LTGCLQIKNDKYYAVLNLKVDGKRKPKWIPLGITTRGNKRRAEAELNRLLEEYAREEEIKANHSEADILLADYLQKWLNTVKPTIAFSTYQSYRNMIEARLDKHFRELGVTLGGLTAGQIQDFYQIILDEGYTTNTVIHYHAVLRKALQSAVKKELIPRNPADSVDKPKKNRYQAAHYTEAEMLALFKVIEGDSLELPIKIAAYYGLRRSGVLGLKWEAVNFQEKTLAINHKIIEAKVDGRFVPVGEDVLKTKSSIRTLPLLPVIEELLLEAKEKQAFMRKLFKRDYCKDYLDYICVEQTGKLFRPNYVTEHFSYLIRKFGLKKIRFHDLRHPYVKPTTKKFYPFSKFNWRLLFSSFSELCFCSVLKKALNFSFSSGKRQTKLLLPRL